METDQEYRRHLVLAEQKSVEAYDRAVMALSGGALGVSFVFIRDVAGPRPWSETDLLLAAWICWGISLGAVLASHYVSHLALRKAISQVDADTVQDELPGGKWTAATHVCNAFGGLLFIVGVILLVFFVSANLGG